jgi:hypothetical protein
VVTTRATRVLRRAVQQLGQHRPIRKLVPGKGGRAQETDQMSATQELHEMDQSLWPGNITRPLFARCQRPAAA